MMATEIQSDLREIKCPFHSVLTVSTSSDDILSTATSATRGTWMDDASKIGHHVS